MSISITGSSLTTGLNNTVQSPAYGSLSFNGLNQSVVTSGTGSGANGTALDITTGAPSWTVECWVYTSQYSKVTAPQYFLNQAGGQTVQFRISSGNDKSYATYGTNFLSVAFYSNVLGYVEMQSWPTTMSLNTWYHIALCKDTSNGERYYLYLNGVLVSSTPALSGITGQNGPWEFGFPSSYITADPSYAFNGYLSNIRIVKGVALYVPPDVAEPSLPLTSTQSLNLSGYTQAITGTQTSLLLTTPNNSSYLTDTSSYAQTVTGVNSPTSSSLAPSTYSGDPGSIQLNGTSQYLTFPNNSVFAFGTGDFTIEAWVYPLSVDAGANQFTLVYTGAGGSFLSLFISSGTLYYYDTATGGPGQVAGGTVVINQWQHLAVSRSGTSVKCYINGVQVISTTSSSNIISGINYIGFNGGSYPWGYISNFRIVKGVAVYTSNFTPPTGLLGNTQSANQNGNPSAAITGTQTSLLLNTPNNSNYLKDNSTNNFTITPVGSPTSGSQNPYSGSILFNGTNQYLTIARAAQFNYSTNDFTWEMWVYPTSSTWTTDIMFFMGHGPAADQGSLHYIANRLVYYNYYNATDNPPYTANAVYPSLYTIGGGSIPANTWTHIAISRQNLVTNMFVNGKVVSSGPDPYNYAAQSGSPFSNPIVSPASQSVSIGARIDGAYPFKGNISNIRIVNGVSVYNVGNFTPPVQPLSPIQTSNQFGSPSKAIFGSQTSLLLNSPYSSSFLKDSSYNNVTVTQQTTGQYPPSTYTMTNNSTNPFNSNGSIFTPGSIFFDGTTQYLTVPANAVFAFGTGAFTVEAWVYLTTLQDILVFDTRTSAATTGIGFQINSSGVLCYIQATSTTLGTSALTTGTWYHIAWVYDGTTVTGYVNGVAGTPSTVSLSLTQNNASIGRSGVSSASFMAGYLSNLRVVTGAAAYTQNFTPTSGPFTTSQTFNQSGIPSCPVQSSQTEFLLNTPANTSFLTDSSTNAFTVTNNGTATSNPFNPFSENYTILANPGSVQLNGTSQYLNMLSSTAFNMSTSSFTVEGWVYLTAYPAGGIANGGLFGTAGGSPATSGYYLNIGQDINTLRVTSNASGGWQDDITVTTGNGVPLNTWTHLAMVRNGDSLVLYKNGVSVASRTGVATWNYSSLSNNGYVGYSNDGSGTIRFVTGYISNVRVVKGLAVYTSNFVPPAAPLNNSQVANQSGAPSAAVTISQTSLMLNTAFGTNFLVDSSINNFTVTNVGTATSATLDPFVF